MSQFGFDPGWANGQNQQPIVPVSAENKSKIKLQLPILILAVIAFAGETLQIFFECSYENDVLLVREFDWTTVIAIFSTLIPTMLLIMYVSILYRYSVCNYMVPLIFGIQLLAFIIDYVIIIIQSPFITNFVFAFIYIVLYGCMFIGALGGFKRKLLLIIPLVIILLIGLYYNFRQVLTDSFGDNTAYTIYTIAGMVSSVCLDLALILFVSKNRIMIRPGAPQSVQTPEQMLLSLKAAYESGSISREEYTARRAEIIKKL